MLKKTTISLTIFMFASWLLPSHEADAQSASPRLALVIGESQYRAGPLPTAANDAGLIAETLRGAGFEVTGAADLDQDGMRRAFRDFLGRVQQAGPNAEVFVYLAGRGLQYEGENYIAPVEATIPRDTDVPIQSLRVSDLTRALAGLPLRARIVVLDAARQNTFARSGAPIAGGLALVDAEPGSLYAFNAAPGTVAPDERGPYGSYAQALAEMLHEGGVPIDEIFARTRLRVNEVTRGAVVPWDVSKLTQPIVFYARAPGAPPQTPPGGFAALQARPIRDFSSSEAYAAAVERDTLAGYQDFLIAFPNDPLAARVRALLAARREAVTWRQTIVANTPNAYWTYMRRYPRGPHYPDARRRLVILSAPLEPPPRFDPYDYVDVLPPPEAEYRIIDRPVIIFDDTDYAPPPPPPIYFLPPPPREFERLPPPPPPQERGFLPIPIPIPFPSSRPTQQPGNIAQPNFGQQGPAGAPPPAPVPQQGGQPAPNALPRPGQPGQPPVPPLGAPRPGPQGQAPAPNATPVPNAVPAPNAAPAVRPQVAPVPAPNAAPPTAPTVRPQVAPAPVPNAAPPAAPAVRPQVAPAPVPNAAPPAAPAVRPQVTPAPAPHAAPPAAREPAHASPPEPAREAPRTAPHAAPAAPVREAPRAAPAEPREAPRAAPAPAREAPHPAAPPPQAPRPAPQEAPRAAPVAPPHALPPQQAAPRAAPAPGRPPEKEPHERRPDEH